MRRRLQYLLSFCLLCLLPLHAHGQPFDLSGPKVDVHVKRGDVTLPISETSNLMPGDRLWIHPDLPESQAAHFVLVVAFLRGSTNPPPPEWFTRVETWTREAREEGIFVNVPPEAQQALLFLAPETGGDFNTLRAAVRGRPGSFVRAAQDLQAASWERMRLETYVANIKVTSQYDLAALKTSTEMAARSLGIKINESCFAKPPEEQASCLSQNSEGMVLDDANAQSLVNQLTTGSTLDLMNALSSTAMAGGGIYSPYIGAIVDTARILSSLHTAHFQYIPALALPRADTLNLRLNMPPSFRNPKSVVVAALPPIGPAKSEPLHAVSPDDSFCALKPGLVLPAEGAPLVFASPLAHDLKLHVELGSNPKEPGLDLPLTTNATKGGLIFTEPVPPVAGGEMTAVVRGKWGFDDWEGPQFKMVWPQAGKWRLSGDDQSGLVVGRDDALHLEGESPVCVDKVELQMGAGHPVPLTWKPGKSDSLEVTVPAKETEPGTATISVYQIGMGKPDRIAMVAYGAAASLNSLTLNSGDDTAVLLGTRLDEVAEARINKITLMPAVMTRVENLDQLLMNTTDKTSSLTPGKLYQAQVELRDGRTLKTLVTVNPPRPQVTLLSKAVQQDADAPLPPVQLNSPDDLPVNGKLVFFLQSKVPLSFPRNEKIEISGLDTSFDTTLSLSDGSLMLEDAHTAVASVDPLARLGSSAFGPVRIRAVAPDGATGDWVPLGTLVRIPGFKELRCPRSAAKPCVLSGSNLFLATGVSATATFDDPVAVSPEFTGMQIVVPHPVNGALYLKLRDDPETVQTLTLPVTTLAQQAGQAMHSPAAIPPAPQSQPATASPAAPATDAEQPKPDASTESTPPAAKTGPQ